MKPTFKHDCEQCRFLGTLRIPNPINLKDSTWDLYACYSTHSGNLNTVLARFGNDGPDYISGLPGAKAGIFPLNIILSILDEEKKKEHRLKGRNNV